MSKVKRIGDKEFFSCYFPGCGKRFATRFEVEDHMPCHPPELYQCLFCDHTALTSQALRRHRERAHGWRTRKATDKVKRLGYNLDSVFSTGATPEAVPTLPTMQEIVGGAAAAGPQEVPTPVAVSPPVQEVVASLPTTNFQLELQTTGATDLPREGTPASSTVVRAPAGVPDVVIPQEDRVGYHEYTTTIHDHYTKTTTFPDGRVVSEKHVITRVPKGWNGVLPICATCVALSE